MNVVINCDSSHWTLAVSCALCLVPCDSPTRLGSPFLMALSG